MDFHLKDNFWMEFIV